MRCPSPSLTLALLLGMLPACNEFVPGAGGGEPIPRGSGSVSGTAGTTSFQFEPARVGATFDSTDMHEGELDVYLCESSCPPLGGALGPGQRMVSLYVRALRSEVRSGRSFTIGPQVRVVAHHGDWPDRIEAVSGEIIIDSSDLNEGGTTVGTFNVELRTGERLSGFFEAPLLRVTEVAMHEDRDD